MRPATDIVTGVRQTEKGTRLAKYDQYIVNVAVDANKVEIRQAVERLFGVHVRAVNTQLVQGKWHRVGARGGRRPMWKKAVVTLAKGQKIELKG